MTQTHRLKNGKFSTNVTLTEGKNVITIVATGGQAKPESESDCHLCPGTEIVSSSRVVREFKGEYRSCSPFEGKSNEMAHTEIRKRQ